MLTPKKALIDLKS